MSPLKRTNDLNISYSLESEAKVVRTALRLHSG